MDKWLVSVVKDGRVIELYYSDELKDIKAIRALHKDCDVETIHLSSDKPQVKREVEEAPVKRTRYTSKKVVCVETGEVFASSDECAKALNQRRAVIYKAISRGTAVDGKHYDYVKE